jgi:protoporphyrinogen oxidase
MEFVGPSQASENKPVIIIGGGPAGLSACYELSRFEVPSTVLEQDSVVGGLARTARHNGYLFDIGGHRFFTKSRLVERMWQEVLGADFLTRSRLSRIYYRGKFFDYPLQARNALQGLGLFEAALCVLSYFWARIFPIRPEADFASWVSNRFGRRLFRIFFESYTEKVWGMKCTEIRAEWAAQRIKGLSLVSVVWNTLKPQRNSDKRKAIKTLIHEFQYPRKGPGMLWERMRDLVTARGSQMVLNAPVTKIHWEPGRITAVEAGGRRYEAAHFISSMPIRDLIQALTPQPAKLAAAADRFRYRDFLTVALVVDAPDLFPDNWIYIHEPAVRVGRIQNYKNWSPDMVPDQSKTCLGLEYFVFEGDDLWNMPDRDLVQLGAREVARLGLVREDQVLDGVVVRMQKAYPVYDAHYKLALEEVKDFLRSVPNLQLVGRNGMHRYNNQDHSMLTAVYAARNILGGTYDLWSVNLDDDYHEQGDMQAEEEFVPTRPVESLAG